MLRKGLFATTLAVILLVRGPVSVKAGVGHWSPVGPFVGDVHAIALDLSDEERLFAGTEHGLYLSRSAGASWEMLEGGLPFGAVRAVRISPHNPECIYVGFDRLGFYRTTDSALSWSPANNGLGDPKPSVSVIAFAPDLWEAPTIFIGTTRGVFESRDKGSTWVPRGLEGRQVAIIVFHPKNADIIFAGTKWNGVFRSTDGGRSWEPMNAGLETAPGESIPIYSLAIDPQNPDILYAGSMGWLESYSIYKSTDGGCHWRGVHSDFLWVESLRIDPRYPETIYAGTRNSGVLKSTDGGISWETKNHGFDWGWAVRTLELHPRNPTVLWAGIDKGAVYKSEDGAENWRPLRKGICNVSVFSVAVDPNRSGRVLAGTQLGLFRTSDWGESWERIFDWIIPGTIALDFADTNVIYAGSTRSALEWEFVFKSTDGGVTWRDVYQPCASISSLLIDPRDHRRIYGCAGPSVFRSDDQGENWTEKWIEGLEVHALTLSQHRSGAVLIGTSNGVWKSEDYGETWTRAGLSGVKVVSIHTHPGDSCLIYAGSDRQGVFKSVDGARSWSSASRGLTSLRITALQLDPLSPDHLFAATQGGVFRSDDGGSNWSAMNDGLPNRFIPALAVSWADTLRVYAGTHGFGLFAYEMSAMSVEDRLDERGLKARDFGLGQNYPNPFNTSTLIPYDLPRSAHMQLAVYNLRGQRVRTLVDAWKPAGSHQIRWDGKDDAGRALPSGVYLVRLEADGQVAVRKVVLVR